MALNAVDILVLAGFAVAQPLFAVLARAAGFFVVHHSTPGDILILVFCAYGVPAGILIGLELLVGAFWRKAIAPVHLAVLALLLSLDLLPVVKRAALPGAVSLTLALAAGAGCAVAYLRIRTWRWSLAWLSPALLVFPVSLLLFSPVFGIVFPGRAPKTLPGKIGNPAPIVMVVFDEFPLSSLLEPAGRIDSELYPNFAELARAGTWYRNATAVGESTLLSLPSIVSGLYPDPQRPRLPDAASYPNNLFTALGGVYRLNVNENNTRLCPDRLCADPAPAGPRLRELLADSAVLWLYAVLPSDLTGSLPDITQSWKDFRPPGGGRPTADQWKQFDDFTDWHDRVRQFREFVDSIRPSPWPAFHFLHVLLPHAPWEYLPSGQRFALPESRIRGLRGVNDRGEDPNRWTGDAWAAAQAYQRHLVQVGLVDRLVGELVGRMRGNGLYDSALLIVTADHGTSFRAGDSRRSITATNHADIMSVPLLIKYPRQRQGGVDDRPVELVDIVPTVLEVLKLEPGWKPEGHSLRAAAGFERRTKSVVTDAERKFEFAAGLEGLMESVRRKAGLFGGESGYDVYRLGDGEGWIGRPVAAAQPEPGLRYQLDHEGYYADVDPGAPMLITYVTGRLVRAGAGGWLPLAVAVNGSVCAVTQSYRDGGEERFGALLPPSCLQTGGNQVAVLRVRSGTELARIERVGTPPYRLGATLRFGAGGNAGPYYGIGWGEPERDITWTDGHLATLYLPVQAPAADVTLSANFGGFTQAGKLDRQRVRVLVNRQEVARWTAEERFVEHTARIPRGVFTGDSAAITFELPDAAAPITLGTGTDSRTLGIALLELTLR